MLKSRYNLIILILGLVFVLGGCLKKVENKPMDEAKPVAVVEVEKKSDEKVGENVDEVKSGEEIDASDWLTYRNEEFGFEMKYSKKWQKQSPNDNLLVLSYYHKPNNIDSTYKFNNHLTVGIKDFDDLEQYIKFNKETNGVNYSVKNYSKINDYPLFEGEIDNLGMSTAHQVLILKNNKIIEIYFEYFYKESLSDFNQIFSTFKFF